MTKDVGFSTENDRDRHYKSGRHHEAPTKGALKGFICVACTDNKVKWWPRQDNFKAHCTRRHTEWDTKELMKQWVYVVDKQMIHCWLFTRSERAVRPTATYTEDNNTVFSDPSYQQQTFPQHHEFIGGYDAVPPSQGKEILQSDGTGSLFCVNQIAGMNNKRTPLTHPPTEPDLLSQMSFTESEIPVWNQQQWNWTSSYTNRVQDQRYTDIPKTTEITQRPEHLDRAPDEGASQHFERCLCTKANSRSASSKGPLAQAPRMDRVNMPSIQRQTRPYFHRYLGSSTCSKQ
jgi:hypothetical protein